MTVDMIQLAYYAGFALLGWWLRHQGIAVPSTPATPASPTPAAPSNTPNQQVLIDLLKSLLDRLAPPATPTPPPIAGNIVHVPIEVAANVKQPSA